MTQRAMEFQKLSLQVANGNLLIQTNVTFWDDATSAVLSTTVDVTLTKNVNAGQIKAAITSAILAYGQAHGFSALDANAIYAIAY